ncbi:MAG: outer membrane beta-barrel protein [Bacteroidota bacterium]|nr:outer membrane beta-barrel protein [Bacteroidota bacterium]
MKRFIPTILGIFLCATSNAQQPGTREKFDPSQLPKIGVLTGTLIDIDSKEPLPFAAVKITHKMSDELVTGGMTDDKGRFKIESITLGPNQVEFAFVGFKTKTQEVRLGRAGIEIDLGKIGLQSSGVELSEVTVEAEREFMTNEIDRKVYDPSKLILSKTGSATDILENIPAVELDLEGNITLRGSSAVRIMIDGRPSRFTGEDLTALLQSLPANSVDKVEVMTNPSAKYDPDGTAGMINIVLKKSALQGFNGSVNSSYSGSDRFRAGINLNYKVDDLNFFFNAGHSSGRYPRSSWSRRDNFLGEDTLSFFQVVDGYGGRNGNNIKAGIDWSPGSKHVFTLQGTINQGLRPRVSNNNTDWTTPFLDYTLTQFSDRQGSRLNNSYDMIYDFKPKKGEELNVRMSYTGGSRDDVLEFTQDTLTNTIKLPSDKYRTNSSGEQWEFNGILDYTKKWNKDRKFEAGVKIITREDLDAFNRTNIDIWNGTETYLPNSENEFLYGEDILAVYSNYGFKKGPWGFQLGLRAEQANITATQVTQDSTFYNNYFQVYPSAFLTYEITAGREINMSYSRRVQRPGGRQLNPFIDYSDPFNLRSGNPYLLPAFTGSYELGYTHILKKGTTLTSNIYFRDRSNLITWYSEVDSNGVNLTTYQNLNSGEDVGLDINFRGRLGKKGGFFSLGGNYFYSQVSGDILGRGWVNQGQGFSLNTVFSTPLWKNASVQIMGNYRSKRVMAQGIGRPFYFIGGGFKQGFLNDRLNLSINCRDIFNTMGWNYETSGPGFYSEGQFRWMNRVVECGLTYNFGEVQRRRRQMDRNSRGGGDMEMEMF